MMRFLILLFISLTALGAGITQAPTDESLVTSDVTTNNASSSKHGFLLKLENTGSKYLRDDGSWQAIAGGGDMLLASSQTVTGAKSFNLNALLLNGTTGSTWLNGPSAGASATLTLPNWTGTLVTAATSQTITDKTLNNPTIAGANLSGTISGTGNLYGNWTASLLTLTQPTINQASVSATNIYGTSTFTAGSKIAGFFDGSMSVSGIWTPAATDAFQLVDPVVSSPTVGNYITFPTNVADTPSAGFGNLYYSGSSFRFKNSAGTTYRFSFDGGANTYTGTNDFQSAVSMTGGTFLGGLFSGSVSAATTTSTSMTGIINVNPTVSGVITVNDNLIAASGKGIDFSTQANPGASSTLTTEVLTRYAHGTFLPTVRGTTASGAGTYSVQTGQFTVIGDSVKATGTLTWSAVTGGTGNIYLSNLPYASRSTANTNSICSIYVSNLTVSASTIMVLANTVAGTTDIALSQASSGTTTNNSIALDTAATAAFTCFYSL